jgi:hypothetical protein
MKNIGIHINGIIITGIKPYEHEGFTSHENGIKRVEVENAQIKDLQIGDRIISLHEWSIETEVEITDLSEAFMIENEVYNLVENSMCKVMRIKE